MTGIFAQWQPRYAEAGISTFPVRDKRPAVKHYLKIGSATSGQLALKFDAADAFGFACRRNRLTILDVDTNDERVLADAIAENGPTPIIVRSGSGNWQAWYRHNGEKRRVRPDPAKPIDILGDGFVVAPPSQGSRAPYEFVQGGLEDVGNLPTRIASPQTELVYNGHTPSSFASPLPTTADFAGEKGTRNDGLWRLAMVSARDCSDVVQLMDRIMDVNREIPEPLSADEVLKIVASAWDYQINGRNWVGGVGRASIDREEILAFPGNHTMRLWLLLKQSHRRLGEPFVIAQSEVGQMLGIRQQHMHRHINELIDHGYIERIYCGKGIGDPHRYRFAKRGAAAA